MSDEPKDNELEEPGKPEGSPEPEAPPTPQPEPTGIDDQERKTWEGRVQAEQRKFDVIDAQLVAQGYKVDRNTGEIVAIAGYEAPVQTPSAEEPEYDPYDQASVQRMIDTRVAQGVQSVLGEIMPVLESNTASAVKSELSDWEDIKGEVMDRARKLGFQTVTALRKQPGVFDLFVDAARGKRQPAVAPSVPAVPPGEREEMLAAGVSVSGGGTPPALAGEYEFSGQDRDYMKEHKMTEEQYLALMEKPVRIEIGGKKNA